MNAARYTEYSIVQDPSREEFLAVDLYQRHAYMPITARLINASQTPTPHVIGIKQATHKTAAPECRYRYLSETSD